jgi:tetratricopeptide (TPR) repeat protein
MQRAVDRIPDDPVARFFFGDLLRRGGDLHGAARELEAAAACPVRFGTIPVPVAGLGRVIRTSWGEVLEQLGRAGQAAALYREALRSVPADAGLHRALARACIASGELDEAEGNLDVAAAQDDAPVLELMRLRAALAFSRGRDAEAATLFARVETHAPRDWAAPLHRGHLALRGGDPRAAVEHYERSLERAETPEARVGLAAARLSEGRVPEALEALVRAVESCEGRPLPAGTEALSGEALLRAGRPAEARDAFERHLRRAGPDARALARLADCYRDLGAAEAARRGYETALRMQPDLAEARVGMAALGSAVPG